MSSLEVLVVLEVVASEVGLGRSTGSAQAVVVLQLLDVIQADADTLVAVGVSSLFVLYWDCVLLGSEALAPGLNLFVQP